MFGAMNTLFSGLAFAGIIFAITLQSQELELQRKELEQTRAELKGQKEQLENQNKSFLIQMAENTFFQMLRLHNDIINGMDIRKENVVIKTGRDCFKRFYDNFKSKYEDLNFIINTMEVEMAINTAYEQTLSNFQADTSHYFRNLYNIIKFIHNSILPNKKMYTNLVRAQLSSYELALLFYNCLSNVGNEKFKPLVEKYSLLKNLDFSLLADITHIELYDNKAFSSSSNDSGV